MLHPVCYNTDNTLKEVKGYVRETLKEGSGVMNSVIEKAVLGVSDIQKHLGVGRRQAYELANSGKFHTVRVGTRILVDREVFENWLKGG
jgi:excisionase family DNA binding protein